MDFETLWKGKGRGASRTFDDKLRTEATQVEKY